MRQLLAKQLFKMQRATGYLLLWVCLSLIFTRPVVAQSDPEELFDPPVTNGLTDLVDTPVSVTLAQLIGAKFQEEVLAVNFKEQFGKLSGIIQREIGGTQFGYLVRVRIYLDDSGAMQVPGGNFFEPIGVGTEPIDSLAEEIRRPSVSVPAPAGSNESYYLWIRDRGGRLTGSIIPRQSRVSLERQAQSEATRRNLLVAWERHLPSKKYEEFDRYQYWAEMADKYRNYMKEEADRKRLDSLNAEFKREQEEFNKLYQRYSDLTAELKRTQHDNEALAAFQRIAHFFETAIRAGQVIQTLRTDDMSSGEAAGVAPRKPKLLPDDGRLQVKIEYSKTAIYNLEGRATREHVVIQGSLDRIRKLDDQIREHYRSHDLPVPKSSPLPEKLVLP